MLDWLTWHADLLLNAAAVVASWFVSKDATSFVVIQMDGSQRWSWRLLCPQSYFGDRLSNVGNRDGDPAK